jgi:hypothetical protein
MSGLDFLKRRLSTTGWAPIHDRAAEFLEPGTIAYHLDFAAFQRQPETLLRMFPRSVLCRCRTQAFGDVLVLSMSRLILAERVEMLLGGAVQVVEDATLPKNVAPLRAVAPVEQKAVDPLERQRALAAQVLPSHDCTLRREILKAKDELERAMPSSSAEAAELEPDEPGISMLAEGASATERARKLVVSMLAAGPRPASEILTAAEGANLSERTTQRAAEQLGVVKTKDVAGWTWALPETERAVA